MFLSFILMNMENFCKGAGDGFRRFNGERAALYYFMRCTTPVEPSEPIELVEPVSLNPKPSIS